MARPGPKIGQLSSKGRRKRHAGYKKSRRVSTPSRRRRLPPSSGFSWLEARGVYDVNRRHLIVTVSSKRRKDNYGPGVYLKRAVPWSRLKLETGDLPQALDAILDDLAEQISGRVFPEADMFLDRCNTVGADLGEFVESTCAKCACWYCDLSE